MLSAENLPYAVIGIIAFIFGIVILSTIKNCVVYIQNNSYGIVERKWSFSKKSSPTFMAVDGSPGFLENVIVGGWHIFMPFQYKIHKQELIEISEIGYLFARSGQDIPSGQALAKWPENVSPEDAKSFLEKGGQRGPQRKILRGGAYAINTALFSVITDKGIFQIEKTDKEIEGIQEKIKKQDGFNPIIIGTNNIGIITVQDGPSLETGDTIAPNVNENTETTSPKFHNGFQDIEAFLRAGGRRGNQEQAITEGTYYINRLFASVVEKPKTQINIGDVGIVNSYTGKKEEPTLEKANVKDKMTSVVPVGSRGIWEEPLSPGKYALNPNAYNVKIVPTTNFQLRWVKNEKNDTKDFDANLSEIRLITKDAFEPILPLTIVVNILPEDAPKVVQQFSDIEKLVTETLDPMVSAWFKDSAQSKTLVQLILERAELQKEAFREMSEKFKDYHLNVREVMIGTPRAENSDKNIVSILEQLRNRQIAKESETTYKNQESAAIALQSFNKAQACADQQSNLTASEISIEISKNKASGELEKQKKEAEGIVVIAEADSKRIISLGKAEAESLKEQAASVGGEHAIMRKTLMEIFMDGLQKANQPLVPQITTGEQKNGQGGLAEILTTLLFSSPTIQEALKTNMSTTTTVQGAEKEYK